jgi:hypothetical protein
MGTVWEEMKGRNFWIKQLDRILDNSTDTEKDQFWEQKGQ